MYGRLGSYYYLQQIHRNSPEEARRILTAKPQALPSGEIWMMIRLAGIIAAMWACVGLAVWAVN